MASAGARGRVSDPAPAIASLETARLRLRPMIARDAAELLAIFADPQVMAAFDGVLFDQARMDQWVQRNLDHQQAHGYGLYSVILKNTGLLIGDCGLEHMLLDGEPVAELGYDFRSDHWHQGYATEAATAVRDFAFHELGLARLISLIRVENRASRRVAEKIGMRCLAQLTRYGHAYWKYGLERMGAD
jgi:ribosomal-protein-alanine N-acetyltransferase